VSLGISPFGLYLTFFPILAPEEVEPNRCLEGRFLHEGRGRWDEKKLNYFVNLVVAVTFLILNVVSRQVVCDNSIRYGQENRK
jgi:hypothetical protein